MERLEAVIKKYIPEAVTWKFITKTSAVIKNTDNNILDGLYENWFISYVDSYEAVFYEYLSFKNGDFFGIESKYREMLKVDDHFAIKNEDIDIYQFCTKYGDADQRTAMIFEILKSHKLNKNKSIRDYVTIKEEFYDEGIEPEESFSERDILIKIYDCVSENNKLLKDYLKSPERMSADDKIFFRSIELLAKSMIDEESSEERKCTADKICELLEDYKDIIAYSLAIDDFRRNPRTYSMEEVVDELGLKDELDFNEETYEAKKEIEGMIANQTVAYSTYTDVEEMIAELLNENNNEDCVDH